MYKINNNTLNNKHQNNLKRMMIENENYDENQSNHIFGYIFIFITISSIVILKWLFG